ncbi:helicase associated domain-containing protein, partial [Streptomyces chartreusis]|uniref:helicase associated domain-containing protein n=1 Tax=Streptomyces chartreusis TaxID=1969 RepID=UPI00363AC8C2
PQKRPSVFSTNHQHHSSHPTYRINYQPRNHTNGQRERLEQLGIAPLPPQKETPAKAPKTALSTFERGVAALAQYKAREGSVTVPRGHVEQLPDGTEVRLGVWIMNQKTRRTKLTPDKLTTLATLGLDWAAT